MSKEFREPKILALYFDRNEAHEIREHKPLQADGIGEPHFKDRCQGSIFEGSENKIWHQVRTRTNDL